MQNLLDLQPCFIIGTAKAATSSLFYTLGKNKNICLCRKKESQYYLERNKKGKYSRFFELNSEHTHFLDASTDYSAGEFEDAPLQIYKDWPNSKIIYVLRDYYDKYVSLKFQLRSMGILRKKSIDNLLINTPYYKNSFMYCKWINKYKSLFGKKNVYVISYDDLVNNSENALLKIQNFLNLPIQEISTLYKENITSKKEEIPLELLSYVYAIFDFIKLKNYIPESIRHKFRKYFSKKINKSLTRQMIPNKKEIYNLKMIIEQDVMEEIDLDKEVKKLYLKFKNQIQNDYY